MISSPLSTCMISRSRTQTYKRLRNLISVPQTFLQFIRDRTFFPVFVKPDTVQGSQSAFLQNLLPRLATGVLVHVHDIFLPKEYPKVNASKDHFFWNEQYLLQAFLIHNIAWKVLWVGSYMHMQHPAILEQTFSSYIGKEDYLEVFGFNEIYEDIHDR